MALEMEIIPCTSLIIKYMPLQSLIPSMHIQSVWTNKILEMINVYTILTLQIVSSN